jgi:hypothetical protein
LSRHLGLLNPARNTSSRLIQVRPTGFEPAT